MVCLSASVEAQHYQKHFSIDKSDDFDKVVVKFQTHGGRCYVSPKTQDQTLKIYSNKKFEEFNHQFDKHIEDRVYYIDVDAYDKDVETVGQSISMKVFNESNDYEEHVWKLMLSKDTPVDLDLTSFDQASVRAGIFARSAASRVPVSISLLICFSINSAA